MQSQTINTPYTKEKVSMVELQVQDMHISYDKENDAATICITADNNFHELILSANDPFFGHIFNNLIIKENLPQQSFRVHKYNVTVRKNQYKMLYMAIANYLMERDFGVNVWDKTKMN